MATDLQRSREIDQLLRSIEPKLQKAFKTGLSSIASDISLSEIEQAVISGDTSRAIGLVNDLLVAGAFLEFNREIQNSVQAGGDIAAKWASADKIVFQLNVTESNTARFINSYQANKVREVTNDLQNVLGEMARQGTIAGENPRKVALRIRESIGLTLKQEQAVRNFERMLRDLDRDA